MNFIKKHFLIFFLFFICSINLQAESALSGNISSVNSDSGFNAIRNPALMSMKKRDNLSLLYIYSYLASAETDSDIALSGLSPETELFIDEDFNGELIISAVKQSGRSSFGFGLTKGPEGQIYRSSTELKLNSESFNVKHKEKREDTGANLIFSYSYRLKKNSAAGIQIENVVSKVSQSTDNFSFTENTVYEDENVDTERNRFSSGISVGYVYSERFFEAGTFIKSGRFGYENREYKYKEKVSGSETDKKISNYFIHDEGAALVGGVNLKPSQVLSFAFEGGVAFPYSYTVKECDQEESSLDKIENKVKLDLSYLLRGGITLRAGSKVKLSAGGSFVNYKAEINGKDNNSESVQDAMLIRASAGADIRVSDGINLIAGAGYSISETDMTNRNKDVSMELEMKKKNIEFIGGITFIY